MARRPAEESTSVSVESCSPPDLEKNLLAAVLTIASSSPTLTMAEARTVTFTGRRAAVGVDVGRLIGDLDVDVDGLRRDDAGLRDDRDDERLAGAAVDLQVPAAAGEQDLARVHAAQERGDDDRGEDEDRRDDAADENQ